MSELGEKAAVVLPLFIQAAMRQRALFEQSPINSEEGLDRLGSRMAIAGQLTRLSQMLEFTRTHPDLAGTSAEYAARDDLLRALSQPDVPDDIRDIYVDLFGLAPTEES